MVHVLYAMYKTNLRQNLTCLWYLMSQSQWVQTLGL